jgi:SNF2 family DNA or RNA helicase
VSNQLLPLQEEGANFLAKRMGALLEDEMGVGKTVQAIVGAMRVPIAGPILVISRPLNIEFWTKTINTWDPYAEVEVATGGEFDYSKVHSWFSGNGSGRRHYLIIYHEMLMTPRSRQTHVVLNDRAAILRQLGVWSLIIADEAHRFASRSAQMTKSLLSLQTLRKWALTGTMMDKSPRDYWTILHWFNKERFGSFWTFAKMYTKERWYKHRKTLVSINTQAFARELEPYRLRRTKVDVRPDIPTITSAVVKVAMTEEQAALYKKAKVETFLPTHPDLDDPLFISGALARIAYLRQIALDPGLVGAVDIISGKAMWLYDFCAQHGEPMVIFTTSREFANTLPTLLDGFEAISGSVKVFQRMQVVKRFRSGAIRGIVGTIATMSESINLKEAKMAIFADSHWSTRSMDQAAARIHRIDSEHPVEILYLQTPGTVDTLIASTIDEKRSVRYLLESYLKHIREERRIL